MVMDIVIAEDHMEGDKERYYAMSTYFLTNYETNTPKTTDTFMDQVDVTSNGSNEEPHLD